METTLFTVGLTLACITLVSIISKKGFDNSSYSPEQKRAKFLATVTGIIAWVLYISILSLTGFIQDFNSMPPRFFLALLAPSLIGVIYLVFSGKSDALIRGIDSRALMYIQTFRVLVEILLWRMFLEGKTPVQMTFEGLNFDVLVGLTAPLAAYLTFRNIGKPNRVLWIVWNLVGLGLLLNIVTIAILSTPVPFRVFMNEPANTIVTHFPYVYIPGVFVVLAFTMHFMSIRKWYLER